MKKRYVSILLAAALSAVSLVEEIRQQIGVDSLEYLSLENLRKIAENSNMKSFCEGCFTDKYPVEVPKEVHKDSFEKIF